MLIGFNQYIRRVNEIHPGADPIKETLMRAASRAQARGASPLDIKRAISILTDVRRGRLKKGDPARPKFKRKSGVAISLVEIEKGIDTAFDDGYPYDMIYSSLSDLAFPVNEMAILSRDKMPRRKIEIDLSGPEGNSFNLIGLAATLYPTIYPDRIEEYKKNKRELIELGEVLGFDGAKEARSIDPVKLLTDEMMSGDRENLLRVFDREFGDYVTLYR